MYVKYNNKRKSVWHWVNWIGHASVNILSNGLYCFEVNAYYWSYRRQISNYNKLQPYMP